MEDGKIVDLNAKRIERQQKVGRSSVTRADMLRHQYTPQFLETPSLPPEEVVEAVRREFDRFADELKEKHGVVVGVAMTALIADPAKDGIQLYSPMTLQGFDGFLREVIPMIRCWATELEGRLKRD